MISQKKIGLSDNRSRSNSLSLKRWCSGPPPSGQIGSNKTNKPDSIVKESEHVET